MHLVAVDVSFTEHTLRDLGGANLALAEVAVGPTVPESCHHLHGSGQLYEYERSPPGLVPVCKREPTTVRRVE